MGLGERAGNIGARRGLREEEEYGLRVGACQNASRAVRELDPARTLQLAPTADAARAYVTRDVAQAHLALVCDESRARALAVAVRPTEGAPARRAPQA